MEEKLQILSNKVLISEADNGDLMAKFAVCGFENNLNGVRLNRETISEWLDTLKNQPLVGRVNPAKTDFESHNMVKTLMKGEDGEYRPVCEFRTDALGTFTDVAIEEVDGKETITGSVTIWHRFIRACKIIKERAEAGVLRTSWEIQPSEIHYDEDGTKVIDKGFFEGLCLLGANVQPAYPDSSYMLEVAEESIDEELLSALMNDCSDIKETDMQDNIVVETSEEVLETVEEVQPEVISEVVEEAEPAAEQAEAVEQPAEETSALTVRDLRMRIEDAIEKKVGKYAWLAFWFPEENVVWVEMEGRESELDYMVYVYTVEGDEVSVDDGIPAKLAVTVAQVNETIEAKDAALASSAIEINSLKEQLSALETYKVAYEKAEAEKLAAEKEQQRKELSEYARLSKCFSEEEMSTGEVANLIAEVDKAGLNQLIAARYMENLKKVSEKTEAPVVASLVTEDVKPIKRNAVKAYLGI